MNSRSDDAIGMLSLTMPKTAALMKQLGIANAQIDAAEGGRLGWVVAFAREDPAQWMPADIEGHAFRLLAFAGRGTGSEFDGNLVKTGPPTPKDVVRLHAELRAKLDELVARAVSYTVTIDFPGAAGLRTTLYRGQNPGENRATFRAIHHGPWRATFWQTLAQLVTETDRLIACPAPKCGRPFLALRKKKFCTPKCAERWHDHAKVEKKRKGSPR